MNGLLLAAGLGTRFQPFTEKIPKPVIPLLNIPIAFYNLHLMQQLGLDNLTINTHHLPDKIKETFHKYSDAINVPLHFSDEKNKILGTGGAIKKARQTLSSRGTFVVANADVVNGFSITDALEVHHQSHALATLIVMEHPEAGKKYGAVWVDDKNQVVHIGKEKPAKECKPFHFVGVHLLEESIFKYIPAGACDINYDVYLKAIAKDEVVMAYEKSGLWFDAGTLQDYLEATESLLKMLPKLQHQPYFLSLFRRFWPGYDRRPNIWEGQGCEHLLPLGNQNKILLGRQCLIHSSVKVSGFAVFGDGCTVDKNAVIENSIIAAGVNVPADAVHTNTLVL
ncbi:MAG: NDP-sugar synthase [Oligoflexia bacterium]|nr:NDP-sugar synthase [Oligoflexia bacterium]